MRKYVLRSRSLLAASRTCWRERGARQGGEVNAGEEGIGINWRQKDRRTMTPPTTNPTFSYVDAILKDIKHIRKQHPQTLQTCKRSPSGSHMAISRFMRITFNMRNVMMRKATAASLFISSRKNSPNDWKNGKRCQRMISIKTNENTGRTGERKMRQVSVRRGRHAGPGAHKSEAHLEERAQNEVGWTA